MKFRLDFVTNSSSSSFYSYAINGEKIRNYLETVNKAFNSSNVKMIKEEELVEIEKLLNTCYDSKRDAINTIKYLKRQYKLQLSEKDIIKADTFSNFGEATQILVDEYGINVDSYIETVFDGAATRCNEIEINADIYIIKSALDEITANKNIKKFVDRYGLCQASSEVVSAYYLAFQREGKTSEDVIAMLGDFALLLND